MKWHINEKDQVLQCQATKRACPFDHYDTKEDANNALQAKLSTKYGVASSLQRSPVSDPAIQSLPSRIGPSAINVRLVKDFLEKYKVQHWKPGQDHLLCSLFQALYYSADDDPWLTQTKNCIEQAIRYKPEAPLDAFIVAAAAGEIFDRLKDNGILTPSMTLQQIYGALAVKTCPSKGEHDGMQEIQEAVDSILRESEIQACSCSAAG